MRFESSIIRNLSVALLCLALTICALVLTRRANAALSNIDRAANTLADYIDDQTRRLQTEKNQKSIEASLATPAIFNGLGRLVSTTTVPRLNATLDQLNRGLADSQRLVNSLDSLAQNTNREINTALLPAATKALQSTTTVINAFGITAQSIDRTVLAFAQDGHIVMDDAHRLLSDPVWKEMAANLNHSSANVAGATENIRASTESGRQALAELPGVARDIHAFTTTTSRARKIIIGAQLLATLAPVAVLFAR